MKVYLIRHGRTIGNEQWLYCGVTDTPLSEGGKEDLRLMVQEKKYPDITGLKVYTSCLSRTEQTLEIIYGKVEHEKLSAFNEMNFGDFENKSYEMMKDDPAYIKWCQGENLKNVCPNGESGLQMGERVLAALKELVEKDEDCVIVCHGGPIAAISMSFFEKEGTTWFGYQPKNGEGYEIEFIDKKPVSIKNIPE